MPIGWAIGGSAIAGLLGAGMQSSAASSAADKQAAASKYAADLQQQQFNTINDQQAPYRQAGYSALNQIGNQMPYLTHQVTAEDLKSMPGFTFGLEQGVGANKQMGNVGGGGSNITRGAEKFATDYATNVGMPMYMKQREGIYNTLAGIAGIGQTGQTQVNQAGMNAASNIGGANMAGAGYQAAGQVAGANAYSGALSNMGNAGMMYGLMNKPGAQYTPQQFQTQQQSTYGSGNAGFD